MAITVEKTKSGVYMATITNAPNEQRALKILDKYATRKHITVVGVNYASR